MEETKQPTPAPPSAEPRTTLTTTSNTYLSTHLIVPYFITTNGEIKRPEHLIAWWSRIFSFLFGPDRPDDLSIHVHHLHLRFLCRLFRDALKPPPSLYTIFPRPNYPTLNSLMDTLNSVYQKDPNQAPKIVFIKKGTFHIPVAKDDCGDDQMFITVGYPIMILGAGQDKTIIHGGFNIKGTPKEGNRVVVQGMTMKGASGCGMYNVGGLSFLCQRMTFIECGQCGVFLADAKGKLINCVATQCRWSGIYCSRNALIELEGSQTKVDGNNKSGGWHGLCAASPTTETLSTSSRIHLLFPLTKESVSTNNGGENCGGNGTIKTVNSFDDDNNNTPTTPPSDDVKEKEEDTRFSGLAGEAEVPAWLMGMQASLGGNTNGGDNGGGGGGGVGNGGGGGGDGWGPSDW